MTKAIFYLLKGGLYNTVDSQLSRGAHDELGQPPEGVRGCRGSGFGARMEIQMENK